jgi:hypothetical protein
VKRNLIFMLVLAGVTLGVNVANAESWSHRVHRREALQRARIHAGCRHGDLTRRELWRLRSGQWRIRRMELRAHGDGSIDASERRRIARAQDRQSRMILRLRHNQRQRWI